MGTIITRKQGNNTYYLYQETYREKINKKDCGKNQGSGKSRVYNRSIYLGSEIITLSSYGPSMNDSQKLIYILGPRINVVI